MWCYMVWCTNLADFCNCLQQEIRKSDTVVINSTEFDKYAYSMIFAYLQGIKAGETVVIKTSVTGKRTKKHEVSVELLETVFSICRKIYPNINIVLCDGPAYVKSYYEECIRLGWGDLLKRYDVSVVDLNHDDVEYIDSKWPIAVTWLNADRILNLCKAKTHKRFGVSLSVKNLLGVLSGGYLGFPKFSYMHEHVPKLLFNLLRVSPRMFNIIDGVNGIEGNGPMHGSVAKSDFVVMGTNPYTCDVRAMIEMGFHPAVVPSAIVPFEKHVSGTIPLEQICDMRETFYDFLPSLSCSWMYKSLNSNQKRLEGNYLNLLKGIMECWELV